MTQKGNMSSFTFNKCLYVWIWFHDFILFLMKLDYCSVRFLKNKYIKLIQHEHDAENSALITGINFISQHIQIQLFILLLILILLYKKKMNGEQKRLLSFTDFRWLHLLPYIRPACPHLLLMMHFWLFCKRSGHTRTLQHPQTQHAGLCE